MSGQINVPNHICKYSGCHYGDDGNRKHYYACPDCDKNFSWRSMGCCFEHYLCYQNEVAISRGKEPPWTDVVNMMIADKVMNLDEPENDNDSALMIDDVKQNKKRRYKEGS